MIKLLRSTGLFLALTCLSMGVFAQSGFKGIVTDANGEGLPGATVTIQGTTIGTITTFDGSYTLKADAGTYTVEISFIGFSTVEVQGTVTAGQMVDLGNTILKEDDVMIEGVEVMASIARYRETPVAISSIKPEAISEKLGSQEFPEILKSTPGVYATRQGGGFGDSRINIRGFDLKNTAVLINGIPVNDMENGWVYFSNWASLSEVTRDIQVQRGLGASKLSIGSVGGTINYITKTTDVQKGGSVYTGIGNNGYKKTSVTLSTGLLENGWAITGSAARSTGEGWADATGFDSWSYFLSIAKRWNNQSLSFTVFGAPQEHGQRRTKQYIADIQDPNKGLRYNPDWGYKSGQLVNLNKNFYHKPQMSLNHFIQFSEATKLVTSAYMSFGTGGGTGNYGSEASKFYSDDYRKDGLIDYDRIVDENIANGSGGSTAMLRASRNDHNWYGILSNVNHKFSETIEFSGGIDLRYYKGKHFREVVDLMGGEFVDDSGRDLNSPTKLAKVGDIINYHNIGEVAWEGLFAQAEYSKDALSAFLSASVNNTSYRRTDYFNYLDSDEDQTSSWSNHFGYIFKGGANYNINALHNVFFNAGYFERAPFFDAVYYDRSSNEVNEGVKNEKVASFELGYGFRTEKFALNFNGYFTNWKDKFLRIGYFDDVTNENKSANLNGVNATHMGVELDFVWNPTKRLDVTGMASIGDWRWKNNIRDVIIYNDDNSINRIVDIYMKDLKVGDAAQTTVALGVNYELLEGLKVGADYNFFDNYYAQFDPAGRTDAAEEGINSWEAPAYSTFDLNVRYNFNIATLKSTVYGNVNNLFDTEYISDADDGSGHDWQSARVFYGIGRTFTVGMKINF